MAATISFAVRPQRDTHGALEFVPVVDGVELIEHVGRFEREHEMDPAGGYGGLIPEFYKFGSAAVHYFGARGAFLSKDGRVPLLGCDCGEWGCWPLEARVAVESATVTWMDFEQPHRPNRDYAGFGPFVFTRSDYERAVEAIAERWTRVG